MSVAAMGSVQVLATKNEDRQGSKCTNISNAIYPLIERGGAHQTSPHSPVPRPFCNLRYIIAQVMQRFSKVARGLEYTATLLSLCVVLQSAVLASSREKHPERPRILGIDHVSLYVSEVEKSRQFYSEVLGLTTNCPQYAGPEPCYLVAPSDQRVLLKRAPAQTRNWTLKNWLAEVAFATDNLMGMRRYLLAHGMLPGIIRRDSDGSQSFRVRDPEGNPIAFVHRLTAKIGYGPASRQISTHLIHAGFVVKDVAAENRFYVDLLGFRLYWYGGFKDDGVDWYELQVPNGPDWIEYMLNIPANADHKELGVQNHFSFGVKNVHDASARLRFNGLRTFDGPEVGRDGKDSLDAYDPDGTRVEVMEFTPKEKPCCHPYSAEHPKAETAPGVPPPIGIPQPSQ
jgi:catechol 2,3-dioxygenase-like lactoylglutathione lyase family enzyme